MRTVTLQLSDTDTQLVLHALDVDDAEGIAPFGTVHGNFVTITDTMSAVDAFCTRAELARLNARHAEGSDVDAEDHAAWKAEERAYVRLCELVTGS